MVDGMEEVVGYAMIRRFSVSVESRSTKESIVPFDKRRQESVKETDLRRVFTRWVRRRKLRGSCPSMETYVEAAAVNMYLLKIVSVPACRFISD